MTAAQAHIAGYGRLDWPKVRETVGPVDCCWADLDGWHMALLPDDTPHTTHLWGWKDQLLWRMRIDGEHAIVAALCLDGGTPTSGAVAQETVVVHTRSASAWPEHDTQVSLRGDDPTFWAWEILEIPGARPVSFVRARRPTKT